MDDLLAEFVAETREMLQASEGELVAWEADPADRSRLDTIFRFVHTVKGNCGFFDFPQLERLSHATESALAEVRAGRRRADSGLVTAVLAVIDRIAEMVTSIENGQAIEANVQDDALIAALEADACDLGDVAPLPRTAAPTVNGSAPAAQQRTIRLPVELLDRVMSGVSDLVLARNDLARRLSSGGESTDIEGQFDRLSNILGDVREAVSRMRMQRIEQLFNMVPRMVRDLSAELGKQVMVEIDGNGVELDREMIELLRDPLTHIIRNAIDHGVEAPGERLAAGKHEIGLLSVSAVQSGNSIKMRVSDDGRGLDSDAIGSKSVAAGIVSEAELSRMDDSEILNLIFAPGLSTAEKVSAISGRGVGMDVVRSNIERLGGSIKVSTTRGEQTVFQLTMPLTLTIIGGLTVAIGNQRFAIPRSFVDEIVHARSHALEFASIGDAVLVTFRGERIRFIDLREELAPSETTCENACGALVIVRLATGERLALGVDRVLDHEELVIKPLSPELAAAELYAGLTLLDDGRPILLLDVIKLAQKSGIAVHEAARNDRSLDPDENKAAPPARKVMVFESLDGRAQAMPMELVRRIDAIDASQLTIENTRVQTVIDGQIFAVTGVTADAQLNGSVRLIRITDGTAELLHAAADISDSRSLANPVIPDADDPTIEGTSLIDGKPVPILDGHWLFASQARVGAPADAPFCRMPQGDEWSANILEPLVEAAGYRVTRDPDVRAQISFALADSEKSEQETSADRIVYLRANRFPAAGMPDSIYRYDREAILSALREASSGGRK